MEKDDSSQDFLTNVQRPFSLVEQQNTIKCVTLYQRHQDWRLKAERGRTKMIY